MLIKVRIHCLLSLNLAFFYELCYFPQILRWDAIWGQLCKIAPSRNIRWPAHKTHTVNPLLSPPSLISHPFQGRKVNKSPSLLSPPPPSLPLPSIFILCKQLSWTDRLWFIQAGNSYCFWSLAVWPPASCAELFQLYALVLCGELLPFSYCLKKQYRAQ